MCIILYYLQHRYLTKSLGMQASILVPVANQDQLGVLWQKDLGKNGGDDGGAPMVQLGWHPAAVHEVVCCTEVRPGL